ncbi:MAG TPA: hypothetical protein VGM39_15230 [Kofleriaceae bacterium]|jgi:hypothetical protein
MASNIAIRLGIVGVLAAGGLIYSQVAGGGARVREADDLADEACACKTASCAEAVGKKFDAWMDKHGDEEVDTTDVDKVEVSAKRLVACVEKIADAPATDTK